MSLSNRISQLMARKEISQRELERSAGISQSTISKLINGKEQNPKLEVLKKVALALDTTIDYLVSDPKLDELMASDSKAQGIVKIYAELSKEQKERLFSYARFLAQEFGILRGEE